MNNKGYHTPLSAEALSERLKGIRHIALDMDGTIYMGSTLFPYTKAFLQRMESLGITYSFLTNNPSTSIDDYLQKLARMGIECTREKMYSTALATIDFLGRELPQARRIFFLGTPSMVGEFERAGYISVKQDDKERPDAVVVAFDKTLTYEKLCRAAWWIQQSVPYVATNPDRVCPTDEQTVLVDCGSLCKCLEWATGRCPDIVLGKPDANMLKGVERRFGVRPEQVAMVGDRIYTDVQMAFNAGAFGVLTLSGETTLQIEAEAPRKPDLTVENIAVLGELLALSRR